MAIASTIGIENKPPKEREFKVREISAEERTTTRASLLKIGFIYYMI